MEPTGVDVDELAAGDLGARSQTPHSACRSPTAGGPDEAEQRIVEAAGRTTATAPDPVDVELALMAAALEDYCRETSLSGLVLGFGGVSDSELDRALGVIDKILRSACQSA